MKVKKFKPGDIVYNRWTKTVAQIISYSPQHSCTMQPSGEKEFFHAHWLEPATNKQLLMAKLLGLPK